MKDGPISKLIINETGHRSTQYKNIIDTLPVLRADKNYQGFDDVIPNGSDLVEAAFTSPYPNTNIWFNTHHVEIRTVNLNDVAAADCLCTPTITMTWQTNVFVVNLQKQLLLEFEQSFKIKSQEFSKLVADKKRFNYNYIRAM